jgi:hypothetical protein
MADRITSLPRLQLTPEGTTSPQSSSIKNPLQDIENQIAQLERDVEASVINTVAGSKVVDPDNLDQSIDNQLSGSLIHAITGGTASDVQGVEALLANSVLSFIGLGD